MRRAIIVGATSGLGLEVAKILLGDGWRIGVAARRLGLLEQLRAACPDRVEVAEIDVTAPDAAERLDGLVDRVGGMDLYFHASGIGWQNPALDPAKELATVDTNALGFARMTGEAFRLMAGGGGGQIAVISSIAGTKGLGAAPAYSATKAFQNAYLQALEQLAHIRSLPIAFTDIRPGFVATALLGDNPRYPMLMQAADVARAIVHAVYARRHVVVIDWRWGVLTTLWRLIPNCVWRRLRVGG